MFIAFCCFFVFVFVFFENLELRTSAVLKKRDEQNEESRRQREQAKNTAALQHHREQLRKVWSAMQTDPVDKGKIILINIHVVVFV